MQAQFSAPCIMAGEERVLAIEHDRADASFDDVGVELDAAVVEEADEPVPMVQAIADGLGDRRLAGDARELLLEPGLERQHERLALFLAHGAALVGASAADRLLDRVERGDALERLAGDRRVAALGDVEELAPQVRPAEGERDRLAGALRRRWSCRPRIRRIARCRDSYRAASARGPRRGRAHRL